MNFFASIHCKSQTHCKTCRAQTKAGIKFRSDMLCRFKDIKELDFNCPYGRNWGFVGLGDRFASIAQPIAHGIDKVLGTNLQNCVGCEQRKGLLNGLSRTKVNNK